MTIKKSILISPIKLNGNSETPTRIYNLFKETNYNEKSGFGFNEIDFDDDVLSATLIKRSRTSIFKYDVTTNNFIKDEISVFTEVSFIIDFNTTVMCVFGSAKNFNLVRSIFRLVIPDVIEFILPQLSAYQAYQILKKNVLKFKLIEVTIQNFQFEDSLVGKYSTKVINARKANEIVNRYKDDIGKITVKMTQNDADEYLLSFGNNGIMTIVCEDEDFNINFFEILNKLFF